MDAIENKPIAKSRGNPAWQKGYCPNPGGRPKGLASRCREATKDGAILIDLMLRICKGELKRATVRDRIEAAKWLADRAFGTAPLIVQMSGAPIEIDLPGRLPWMPPARN